MNEKTFNLNSTGHESGLIIRDGGSVFVANWQQCQDNELPVLSPWGDLMPWQYDGGFELVENEHLDDVRPELPGTVWINDDGDAETDMDVVYDANGDISCLWGIRTGESDPESYTGSKPYAGTVWEIQGLGVKVITIDNWG